MPSALLAKAVGNLARVMARDPSLHAELNDAFLLLTESLVSVPEFQADEPVISGSVEAAAKPRAQENAERLAALLRLLADRGPAQRMSIVRERTGWSRATYFRALKEARQLRLIA